MQKARLRNERVEKLAANLINKLAIFTEAATSEKDKAVTESFKVSLVNIAERELLTQSRRSAC